MFLAASSAYLGSVRGPSDLHLSGLEPSIRHATPGCKPRQPVEVDQVRGCEFVRFWQICRFLTNLAYRFLHDSHGLRDLLLRVAGQPQVEDALVPRVPVAFSAAAMMEATFA